MVNINRTNNIYDSKGNSFIRSPTESIAWWNLLCRYHTSENSNINNL
jgi:hypothetical protein